MTSLLQNFTEPFDDVDKKGVKFFTSSRLLFFAAIQNNFLRLMTDNIIFFKEFYSESKPVCAQTFQ